jgi:DNA topoisomerase VI subunit A
MDIIKANEYRPPLKGIFNNKDISKAEGEEQDPQETELSLKEQAKASLAAAVTADKEALAEEEAIEHDGEVEDEEREGGKVEKELPDIN